MWDHLGPQDTEAKMEQGFHLHVTCSSGPLYSTFTLLEARMGVPVKDCTCCVPLPGDKSFAWTFFLKVVFFIVCLLLIYLECSIQCPPREMEKYLNVLSITELYKSFNSKETLCHFSIIYSQLSTEGTKRCVSITKTRAGSGHHGTELRLCSRNPEMEGASSRSSSPTEDGKGNGVATAHTQSLQLHVMFIQHFVNLCLTKPTCYWSSRDNCHLLLNAFPFAL